MQCVCMFQLKFQLKKFVLHLFFCIVEPLATNIFRALDVATKWGILCGQ